MPSGVLVWIPTLVVAAALSTPLNAHSWYPPECCREIDCAPVDHVVQAASGVAGGAQLVVTSKHGTVIVPPEFPRRESKDGRMHICIGYDPFGSRDVLCLFVPPSM